MAQAASAPIGLTRRDRLACDQMDGLGVLGPRWRPGGGSRLSKKRLKELNKASPILRRTGRVLLPRQADIEERLACNAVRPYAHGRGPGRSGLAV